MTKFQSDIEGIEVQCLDFLCKNLFLVQDMLTFVHGVYMVLYMKGYSVRLTIYTILRLQATKMGCFYQMQPLIKVCLFLVLKQNMRFFENLGQEWENTLAE